MYVCEEKGATRLASQPFSRQVLVRRDAIPPTTGPMGSYACVKPFRSSPLHPQTHVPRPREQAY